MPEFENPPAAIELSGVKKQYGDVTALADVDLAFDPGTFHCLVGPNGSGKTTLLRIILGLTRPTSGEVSVPDAPLGVAFQRPSQYEAITVAENLDVFGAMTGADPAWTETVVDRLGLDAVRHRVTSELSGGYARKLEVALALTKEPAFALLDEPLADLDDVTRKRLVDTLADYCAAGGAVVVSTHDLDVFANELDRLTILADGEVLQDSRRADLPVPNEGLQRFYVERVLAAED